MRKDKRRRQDVMTMSFSNTLFSSTLGHYIINYPFFFFSHTPLLGLSSRHASVLKTLLLSLKTLSLSFSLHNTNIFPFFSFLNLMAIPRAYCSSWTRGQFEAAAAVQCHSQRNTRSKPHL